MAKNMQKPLVFVGQNKDACFYVMIALETDSGPILGRFWTPKSSQDRPQKGLQKCSKSDQFSNAFLDRFLVNMAPTWPDLGPQDGPKLGPKWDQNQTNDTCAWTPNKVFQR